MDGELVDRLQAGQRRAQAHRQGPGAVREQPAARRAGAAQPGTVPLLALQRRAGNAAVTALVAARSRPGGDQRTAELDAARREAERPDPDLPVLETGLKAAEAVGVPVDVDGAGTKPPPSALAVTLTGFGPAAVPDKKPAPPAKPTATTSPLGRAAGRRPGPKGGGSAAAGKSAAGPSPGRAGPAPVTGGAPSGPGRVDVLAPPVPPSRTPPTADPAFAAVTGAVTGYANRAKAHPPAAREAAEAQDAAVAPSDDVDSQAKAAKVDTMDAQPAGTFDKKAFIAAVKAAVDRKTPTTLKEADEYEESGKAGEVKDEVKGLVAGNAEQSAAAIESATDAPPDTSKAVPKPVTPMVADTPGSVASIPAGGAAPKPAPPEQLNLAAGKHEADAELAGTGVTEDRLAQSNEPEFTGALAAKDEAAEHADTAPAQVRQQEATVIAQARTEADTGTKAAVAGMHGSKATALAQAMAQKSGTKGKDEARRAEVSAKVQSIFSATEADVKKILDGIDPKVDKVFEQGEKAARDRFEAFVDAKMSAFKRDRYGGLLGPYRWVKDKLTSLPSVVNTFYAAGKEAYLADMDTVITRVADVVGTDLNAAKNRIAAGKAQITDYVKTLPAELKEIGSQAAEEVGGQFDRLESDVTAKQDALVDSLATKYTEARSAVDARIEEMQEANKGLVAKAVGAIKGVVQTIGRLKDMLLGVLSRAAGVIGAIIGDPIGFLGKFVNAVKTGIQNFAGNILEHLKKGLQAWLFGALSAGGVELPETFDLKGVLKLVASIIGLTWASIRARIAKRIGEPVMSKVESGLELVKLLATEGVGGLWQLVLQRVGDLKDMVMNQVKDMVVTQIIKAGITWLISMLNPAGAFIKACKMIYDIVMFFVEKAAQIKEFVDAVLDSVQSIVSGGAGAVTTKIEQTLAKALPVVIGFLASALGLGGISEKIKKIIETVQKPVRKAVDWVVDKAVAFGRKLLGGVAGKVKAGKAWVKGKVKAGKAWVKGKAEAGKAYVKGRLERVRTRAPGRAHADAIPGSSKIDIAKPLDMSGKKHTIFVTTVNGRLDIEMASQRTSLRMLLLRAERLAEVLRSADEETASLHTANANPAGLVKRVKAVHVPLGKALSAFEDERTQRRKATAALEIEIQEHITKAAGLLADISREYGLSSLEGIGHASTWVTAESELKMDYRGEGFRRRVYGGWDRSNGTGGTFRNARFDELRALIRPGAPELAHPDAYRCPECGRVRLDVANSDSELTLDHVPSVVKNWKDFGNNSSWQERNDWYNGRGPDGAQLEPMCRSCNSRKGGGEEDPKTYKVGSNFRGKNEGRSG